MVKVSKKMQLLEARAGQGPAEEYWPTETEAMRKNKKVGQP